MNLYRSRAVRDSAPWRVTSWQKFYVRLAKKLGISLITSDMQYQREFRRYQRKLQEWRDKHGDVKKRRLGLPRHQWGMTPPMPLPPPAPISE